MRPVLTFPDQLRLINERSDAFRAAVAAAPSLDVQMATHPARTLFDHVQHVGMGRRKAAAIVTAGLADGPPAESAWGGGTGAPREREALLAWWVESVAVYTYDVQFTGAAPQQIPEKIASTVSTTASSPSARLLRPHTAGFAELRRRPSDLRSARSLGPVRVTTDDSRTTREPSPRATHRLHL